jgi:3D-(3,5/4)-trihydroxycyclohexane-1,2-dione acylhydrolase (decyclizing)
VSTDDRARAVVEAGGVAAALDAGLIPRVATMTTTEAVVLGLLAQDVRTFVGVLGHGSTQLGETLRRYQSHGALKVVNLRHETEASHVATALRWITGEKAAVVTSIGPGALQAFAGSLVAASDGIGVWHLYGDETTEDEGPNMQQIPRSEQGLFVRLCATMGAAYSLHTPAALPTALRRGAATVDHPHRAGPFFLLLPLNTQPLTTSLNLEELLTGPPPPLGAAADRDGAYLRAAEMLLDAERVVLKVGGGARRCGAELAGLADAVDAVVVHTPVAAGVLPHDHPRNMGVGGSKGSISGNHAMERADLLLAVGTRAVCQSDCSRTGYPGVEQVISIDVDAAAALHYGRNLPMVGDAGATLERLSATVAQLAAERRRAPAEEATDWLAECTDAKQRWASHVDARLAAPQRFDPAWNREVLTQPATIERITTRARRHPGAVCVFDAGDVQANGFQMARDDRPGRTVTETGASYMGFATCAVLVSALSERAVYPVAVTGDGSFTMNPQVLVDGVAHGAVGCIVILDNRRMGAISSLQVDQYGHDVATADGVAVDYARWASAVPGVLPLWGGTTIEELDEALERAFAHPGLSVVHVPVYWGPDPLGGLGAWGRWNVGSWVEETQSIRHEIGL